MAFYALGETLFQQAISNYASLLIAGEFDGTSSGTAETRSLVEGATGDSLTEEMQSQSGGGSGVARGASEVAVTARIRRIR